MKRAAIAICCALASVSSFGGDWVFVGANQHLARLLDVSNIVKGSNIRGVWTLLVFKTSVNGEMYRISWIDFDCQKKIYRESEYALYSGNGRLMSNGKYSGAWSHAFPGSIAETDLKVVCQKDYDITYYDQGPNSVAKTIKDFYLGNGYWK